jgi:hypothetical protein
MQPLSHLPVSDQDLLVIWIRVIVRRQWSSWEMHPTFPSCRCHLWSTYTKAAMEKSLSLLFQYQDKRAFLGRSYWAHRPSLPLLRILLFTSECISPSDWRGSYTAAQIQPRVSRSFRCGVDISVNCFLSTPYLYPRR